MPAVVILGSSWLLGIATVALWGAPPWLAGGMLLALAPAASIGWLRVGARVLLIAAVVAMAGAWRFAEWEDRPAPDLARHLGSEVVVEGAIASMPARGAVTTSYRFEVTRIRIDGAWETTSGAARLVVGQYAEYARGERLQVEGQLSEAPSLPDFDYRGYLARQGIVGILARPEVEHSDAASGINIMRPVDRVRLSLQESLERSLPEPQASLAAGIALGRDDGIPVELYDDFRTTGLAHIVAVSGSNVALLTGIVFLLLTRVAGYYRAILPAGLTILLYVFLAGAEESVIRAGLMAAVFLASLVLGRQQSGIAALAVAAVAMTAFDPGTAVDVGFQLSLGATAGLLVFGPWMEYGLKRVCGPVVPWAGGLLRIMAWTMAATVGTLPVTWLTFGQVSVVGVAANVIVEPVFALALAMSLVTAVAGAAWEPAGWVCGMATYYPLALITAVADELARVPGAAIATPQIGGTWAAAMYAGLMVLALPALRYLPPEVPWAAPRTLGMQARRFAFAGAGGGLAVAAWWLGVAPMAGPGRLEMAVLDVGQGDAILVTTPGGSQVLVDGGRSGLVLAEELGAVMPHWDRKLEAVVLTHPQEDHVAGLPEALRRYRVDAVYDDGAENDTEAFAAFEEASKGAEILSQGDSFTLDEVTFRVLWPPADRLDGGLNDRSLVILVEYGETRFLLTGDIEGPAQGLLIESGEIEADVLKVPHHGAATSITAFFDAVGAEVAVISVGEGNQFNHPRQATLEALEASLTYRTDEDGRVVVSSDGRGLSVHTER